MASATDWTSVSPTVLEAFLVQAETTVRVGKARYFGALEVSSGTYNATYDYASQGLQAAQAINLGLLEGVSIELTAEFEDIEATNVLNPGIKFLSAEGAVVNATIKQFEPDIINVMIQNGIFYTINTKESFITFGGSCTTKSRPLELSVVNLACATPSAPDVANGITGLVFTLYDGQFTSGINWGDVIAGGFNSMDATYEAQPWLDRALGNRLGNLLIF
jgi:hypothetical protein